MKNYVLHFIRHGRTEHQRQGVYMGRRTGSELSAEGIGELLALRREYDYPSAEVVFSSPLPHCLQTADFLYPESRLMVVDELAEMDFGSYEGKSLEELKDDPEFGRWLADSHHQKPPEGESGEEFLIRIQAAVAAMIDYMAQNEIFEAAVVTHGGVIATLMSTLGLPEGALLAARDDIVDALKTVSDPEIPINIYDMGFVYDIRQLNNGNVEIDMTLTAPTCPVAGILPHGAATACDNGTEKKG